MTIAVCYVSPEGIVLGADSTSSIPSPSGMHYFNFNQKVFELGVDGTLGIMTWGLGALGNVSYRTIIARLADQLAIAPVSTVADVAAAFIDLFWEEYQAYFLVQRAQALHAKVAYQVGVALAPNQRTEQEEAEYNNLRNGISVGFCIAGYLLPSRVPSAANMFFEPLATVKPVPQFQLVESSSFWGVPNMIDRLIHGADYNLKQAILASPHWTGTAEDLAQLVSTQTLSHASLPIRDAVDYVYSCIHSTIRAMKFSSLSQVCGGPIEVAVISTDRKFRWVRHKSWDAAILDGESNE